MSAACLDFCDREWRCSLAADHKGLHRYTRDGLRSVSYGGGVQSTALLVLAAQGTINFPLFIFANTGEESEHPATLRYVREVAMPYAEAHGIEMVEVQRRKRGGAKEDLRDRLDAGRTAIPVRRRKEGKPMSRSCTTDFKVKAIEKELRRRGATEEAPAIVAIGISVDEIARAKSEGVDPKAPTQYRVYPLLKPLHLTRMDCRQVIADGGLPVPPKSACWFCPMHDGTAWTNLRKETPDLFEEACKIEAHLSASSSDGKPVYLTRKGVPLAEAVRDDPTLFGDDCESGYCMT